MSMHRNLRKTVLVVAAGGAAGALARFGFHDTQLVNALGCLALALLLALADAPVLKRHPVLRVGATVGFLGAFTTFSTLSGEIARLFLAGRPADALRAAAVSLVLGYAAVLAGHVFGRWVVHVRGWGLHPQGTETRATPASDARIPPGPPLDRDAGGKR
jgi:fluoride exporter